MSHQFQSRHSSLNILLKISFLLIFRWKYSFFHAMRCLVVLLPLPTPILASSAGSPQQWYSLLNFPPPPTTIAVPAVSLVFRCSQPCSAAVYCAAAGLLRLHREKTRRRTAAPLLLTAQEAAAGPNSVSPSPARTGYISTGSLHLGRLFSLPLSVYCSGGHQYSRRISYLLY